MTDAARTFARTLAPHRGDWMRKALEYADVSSKQMADYLEVTPATVSRWLNAKAPVSKQTLRLWALRTGVPLAYLETGEIPADDFNPVGPAGIEPTTSTVESGHLAPVTPIFGSAA